MRNIKISAFLFLSLILSVCLSGCVVTKVHTLPVETYSLSYDDIWNRILTYLNSEKEPIVVCDKDKGIIATDWVHMHKVFSVKRYRYEIQVKKLTETEIQVGISSPQESYEMGDWEPALPSERRPDRIFKFISGGAKMAVGEMTTSETAVNYSHR